MSLYRSQVFTEYQGISYNPYESFDDARKRIFPGREESYIEMRDRIRDSTPPFTFDASKLDLQQIIDGLAREIEDLDSGGDLPNRPAVTLKSYVARLRELATQQNWRDFPDRMGQ